MKTNKNHISYKLSKIEKKKTEREHFKKRLKERFNIEVNRFDIQDIIKQILTNKAKLLNCQSRTRSVYLVNIKNIEIKIIFDELRKEVITVLF